MIEETIATSATVARKATDERPAQLGHLGVRLGAVHLDDQAPACRFDPGHRGDDLDVAVVGGVVDDRLDGFERAEGERVRRGRGNDGVERELQA